MENNKKISLSMIFGIISAALILISPFIRFATYSHSGHRVFDYNFFKFCDRASYIEVMWRGLPYGIVIAGVIMLILSFINIPLLKLFPCALLIAVLTILVYTIYKTGKSVFEYLTNNMSITFSENISISDCIGPGIYLMVLGLFVGIVSCFFKASRSDY